MTAAYERAAAALVGALEEMRDSGRPLAEGAQTILLKHLLAHFDGLEAQYRSLLDPDLGEQLLEAARQRSAASRPDAKEPPPG